MRSVFTLFTYVLFLAVFFSAVITDAAVIFIVGDSTAATYGENRAPMTGWGQCLCEFTAENVTVENRAVCGKSLRSFLGKNWDDVLNQLQEGDYVFIQFGHNDQKVENPEEYARTGYKELLRRYIAEVRAKGASPVLLTSVTRMWFEADGKTLRRTLLNYPQCMREVAAETETPLLDMNEITRVWLEKAGPEKGKTFFTWGARGELVNYPDGVEDHTHFCRTGAVQIAEMVVNEVKRQNLPAAACFR